MYRKCIFFQTTDASIYHSHIPTLLDPQHHFFCQVSSEKAKETEQQCRVKAEKDAIECRLQLGRVHAIFFGVWGRVQIG